MNIYEIPVVTIDGDVVTLAPYRGRMMLIVNVASRCGFTPQYAALEALYQRHGDSLVVLGFPCNQFGSQEPGSDGEIRAFCRQEYMVTFPLFARVDVNGPDAHPLYRYLKSTSKGLFGREAIAWNFTKFLVSTDGAIRRRYGSFVSPARIEKELFG